MIKNDNNLLIGLVKFADRNKENFTTEAFVHLFRYLKEFEPKVARYLLKEMTNKKVDRDVMYLTINSQKTHAGVRPDIEIVAHDYLIFVEVKVSAQLNERQMETYLKVLKETKEENKIPNGILILLSDREYKNTDNNGENKGYDTIRWFKIAEWLQNFMKNENPIQDTSIYVIEEFVAFLKEVIGGKPEPGNIIAEHKKMLSEKRSISHPRIESLEELHEYPTLYNTLSMMDKVIDIQLPRTFTSGSQDAGRSNYIGYDILGSRYCFYIYFNDYECKLIFMTWGCQIDSKQAKDEKYGNVVEIQAEKVRWQNELNLNGYVHFFSASKSTEDQFRIIDFFYRKSYDFAKKITVER